MEKEVRHSVQLKSEFSEKTFKICQIINETSFNRSGNSLSADFTEKSKQNNGGKFEFVFENRQKNNENMKS